MVRLEFRDQFHLEESPSCEFDKLEVHNGGHGYSPLAGTFCGREFPKPIQSEGRELYLKFTSDASIEYVGFKAVYSFIPAPSKSFMSNKIRQMGCCLYYWTRYFG